MAKKYRVTSVGLTPAEDRARRMRFYFIAMSLRVACVGSLIFVRGWWILVAAIGAAVLPYLAVMVGNASSDLDESQPDAPAPRQLPPSEPAASTSTPSVIVVDAQVHRRSGDHADEPVAEPVRPTKETMPNSDEPKAGSENDE